jgi:cell division protease FtsH
MADNEIEIDTDIEFESIEDFVAAVPSSTSKPVRTKIKSRDALVELALMHAVLPPLRRRLKTGKIKALIVKVPDPSWVVPVSARISEMAQERVLRIERQKSPGKDRSVIDLARQMSLGRQVIGISSDPDAWLPEVLVATAQERIEIPPLNARMVKLLLRMCQRGSMPTEVDALRPEAMTFDEVTSIVVPGARVGETVDRLSAILGKATKVGTRKDNLPRLEDAHEYGAARKWALDLRDDLADVRAGRIAADQVDKGVVLYGPPGTGKTLLARMIGEALGIPTVISSVAGWFASGGGYLSEVIKAQRAAFDEALAQAPAILLLDEINALANIDHLGESRNKDYWAPVILDFYQLLDGAMQGRDGLIVIGTTNRIKDLNPALLRPGRLERAIHVGPPDARGVENIMRHHLAGDLVGEDLTVLAQVNAGHRRTGAEIMEQVRAARRLARRAGRALLVSDLKSRIFGDLVRSDEDVRRAAVHEAGHVIAARGQVAAKLQFVTIASTGDTGGGTKFDAEDRNFRTRSDYEGIVVSLLGGRAAEQVVLGEPSQGSGGHPDSDLAKATKLVALMHCGTGLGDTLSYLAGEKDVERLLTIDPELRDRVETSLRVLDDRTVDIITAASHQVTALADALVDRNYLSAAEVESIIGKRESAHSSPGNAPSQPG